ncbi:unnamed protein product [Blepharisma stoltei]|uniref:TFIIS N-terminal domain-containing protein n=1 Tax=Blepharisma stoltei TaxID=1481888 RepID=A0AAU9J4Q1_9CILI|nr:unnamed protein product [Blepharisma stoltei]
MRKDNSQPKQEEQSDQEDQEPITQKPIYEASSDTSSEEENNQEQSEDGEEIEEIANLFKKRTRRRRHFEDNEEDENLVDSILKEMDKAADDDIDANRNDLPALNKLKILDKVTKFLIVSKYHDLFLEMNGTFILGKWLAQMPDGSFPSTPLKLGLLQAIQDLPISTKNLQESDLGKSVMAIYRNPNETVNVKRIAKLLIDKWSRIIYEIETNYTILNQAEENEDPEVPRTEHPKPNLNKILYSQENNTPFARIPEKNLFDFKYRPTKSSEDHSLMPDRNSEAINRLKKKLQIRKKRVKRATGEMSVDGRNLY